MTRTEFDTYMQTTFPDVPVDELIDETSYYARYKHNETSQDIDVCIDAMIDAHTSLKGISTRARVFLFDLILSYDFDASHFRK